MDIFLNIFAGVSIAALSSWITVHLSLRRYRTEKWWEKKAEAYSVLLGAIHDAKAFAEIQLLAEHQERELSAEEATEIYEKTKKSGSEVYRAMDVGAFYLSKEAIMRLKLYKQQRQHSEKAGDWIQYLKEDLTSTDSCLKDMIELAHNDLKITEIALIATCSEFLGGYLKKIRLKAQRMWQTKKT